MKKSILLLLTLCLGLFSCKKIKDETTIAVELDKQIEANVYCPENGDYLNEYSKAGIVSKYIEELEEELNRGKLKVVDGNADYVLYINRLVLDEDVEEEWHDGGVIELSTIDSDASFSLHNMKEDLPRSFAIGESVSETVCYDKDDNPHEQGFGGLAGAFEKPGKATYKKVKDIIVAQQ